jgi:hypothetical protein
VFSNEASNLYMMFCEKMSGVYSAYVRYDVRVPGSLYGRLQPQASLPEVQ